MMMSHRSGAMRQLLPAILALVGTAASFAITAAPARAATNGPFYAATLTRPMDGAQKLIQKGVLWKCEGAQCSAPRDTSRPAIVCARLVQKVGPVARFATPQGDLAAEDLARCNEAAAN
ncbi:MAG: hypothetical protein V4521_07855 [Pseudomonadota bacterium]